MGVDKHSSTAYLTLLSVLSAVAVVYLHTNTCFWDFRNEPYWFSANIIESVFYFAVPIFFMISGATLFEYRKRYTTKEYFKKRIWKTVVPYILWSLVGVVFALLSHTYSLEGATPISIARDIINNRFVGGVYWFFMSLFVVYLCIPLFSAIEEKLRKNVLIYLAIGGFTLNLLLPFLVRLTGHEFPTPLQIPVASGYVLYAIVGYLLAKYEMPRQGRIAIYALAVVGLVLIAAGTYKLSIEGGAYNPLFKDYLNVPAFMYSAGLFLLFKQVGNKIMATGFGKAVRFLGGYTFALYLMHWFVLMCLVHFLGLDLYSLAFRLVAPWAIVAICVAIAFVVRLVPVVGKKILP